jgi:2-iminobutanoate/2-iminopropanoate deaminase
MKTIHTDQAPAVVGPYSQAIVTNNLVFCAGQIGLNPETKMLETGLVPQVEQVMKNLQAVLEQAGCTPHDIVKTTIFLTDMENYHRVNEVYGSYFQGDVKPARSTVAVSALPMGALVEIECIACIND